MVKGSRYREELLVTDRKPLGGVRILNIGGAWAERLTAMLLADQGADVIEVHRQSRRAHPADPLLGKRFCSVPGVHPAG